LESYQNHVKEKKNVFQIRHMTDTCCTSAFFRYI